ncbi:MAG: hypothetical protein H5U15_05900 [Roseovarius sp.]|jgi:transposase InsO family protein|nr:hypothetical protein [Roseovarius sp.]
MTGTSRTEVTKFPGPWKSFAQAERETLKWYDRTRPHGAIGCMTPNEAREILYATLRADEKAA